MTDVSVAMATYDAERYLHAQLESIRRQTHPPAELVVSDDGSTDETIRILHEFAESAGFPVRILRNEVRVGVAANFAAAFQGCTSDIIAPSDQDDMWRSNKLALLAQYFTTPDVMLVFSDVQICDSAAHPTGVTQWQALGFGQSQRRAFTANPLQFLLGRNVVTGCAMAFRRSLLTSSMPIPDGWLHDEWLAIMAAIEGTIVPVDVPLVDYRQHSAQQVGPGIRGPLRQMNYARRHLTDDYLRRQVQRSQSASHAISRQVTSPRAVEAIHLFDARSAHYCNRLKPTAVSIVTGLSRGDYRRFSYGWKGVLQDSILRPVSAALKL